MNRLVVIGLDCLTPQLALDAWLGDMPNLKGLLQRGVSGPLRSTIPPITCQSKTLAASPPMCVLSQPDCSCSSSIDL